MQVVIKTKLKTIDKDKTILFYFRKKCIYRRIKMM